MSDFVDRVAPAPGPEPIAPSTAVQPAASMPVVREAFIEGEGYRPVSESRDTIRDGEGFVSKPGGGVAREVMIDGGSTGRVLPASLYNKLREGWGEKLATEPAAATPDAAKPAEPAPEAKAADPAATPAEVKPAEPEAKPTPAGPPPEVAELAAARDRLAAQNAKLLADLDAARGKPAEVTRSKLDEAADAYIDDSVGAIRRMIAHTLGLDDPEHADVTTELQSLTNDLTAKVFGVSLDPTQQASRDTAKVRQALARDKRSRKAESDEAAKAHTAQAEQAKAQQFASFIGNRLSLPRDGGKSYQDQFPVAAQLAPLISGKSLEETILEAIPHLSQLGILDQARANDDDYLVSETAKYLNTQYTTRYQALADAFGKAQPPSPQPPPASAAPPPSTATTPPAPEPAAPTSASSAPPQGHGGRTLTTADSSVAPASLPSAPAPTQPAVNGKKLLSRKDFLDQRYGPGR